MIAANPPKPEKQTTEPVDMVAHAQSLQLKIAEHETVQYKGRVVKVLGTTLLVSGIPVKVGQRCLIGAAGKNQIQAEVVGFDDHYAVMFPFGETMGIALGASVTVLDDSATIGITTELLGRVIDGFGQPLDSKNYPPTNIHMPLRAKAPSPLERQRVNQPLCTGIKMIDALLTVGLGQRLGVFAPAGVGKSTLLGMLAGAPHIDVVVVALIGERGREVREFIEDTLDDTTRQKSVLVVATSDRSAMERINAAYTATALAEGFAQSGANVLLLMDSITRFSRAVREVGLAAGEPPVRQGFPPSVFAELPRLLERAGSVSHGSITAFYTILTDDENANDPIAEEAKSILDGTIILSRQLAERSQFPAIDVLSSISRLFPVLANAPHMALAQHTRELLAKYKEVEFLVQVGEYNEGSDPLADKAIAVNQLLQNWFMQTTADRFTFEASLQELEALLGAHP